MNWGEGWKPVCPTPEVEDMALAIATMKRSVELYGRSGMEQQGTSGLGDVKRPSHKWSDMFQYFPYSKTLQWPPWLRFWTWVRTPWLLDIKSLCDWIPLIFLQIPAPAVQGNGFSSDKLSPLRYDKDLTGGYA